MIAALLLFHNPNWREVISLPPSEIKQWAEAICAKNLPLVAYFLRGSLSRFDPERFARFA